MSHGSTHDQSYQSNELVTPNAPRNASRFIQAENMSNPARIVTFVEPLQKSLLWPGCIPMMAIIAKRPFANSADNFFLRA